MSPGSVHPFTKTAYRDQFFIVQVVRAGGVVKERTVAAIQHALK